jgi:hypothetical protein
MQAVVPSSGTISRFYVRLSGAAGGGSTSYTFTVRIDGADTGITCTATGAATSCSDTSNSASVTAGQLISILADPSATQPNDNLDLVWSARFN